MIKTKNISLLDRIEHIPSHFADTAEQMDKLEVGDFAFYGGAIRDHYLGISHNDVDVTAFYPKGISFWRQVNDLTCVLPEARKNLGPRDYISPELTDVFAQKGIAIQSVIRTSGHTLLKFNFLSSDRASQSVDLKLMNGDGHLLMRQDKEAPINTFFMDSKGHVQADVDSFIDLEDRVFAPFPDLSQKRLLKAFVRHGKLKPHIEGLKLSGRHGHALQVNAWNLVNWATADSVSWTARELIKYRHRVLSLK